MQLLSMRREVGIGIVAMAGAGVEEEVGTSVVVEEEGTMALMLIHNLMEEVTTRKLRLLKAVVLLHNCLLFSSFLVPWKLPLFFK